MDNGCRRAYEEWCKREKYSCDKDSHGNYFWPASSRFAAWQTAWEYKQPSEPVGDDTLIENMASAYQATWDDAFNFQDFDDEIKSFTIACMKPVLAIAQSPLRQQLHQIDQAATNLITALTMGWDVEEYVLKLQDVLPGYQEVEKEIDNA